MWPNCNKLKRRTCDCDGDGDDDDGDNVTMMVMVMINNAIIIGCRFLGCSQHSSLSTSLTTRLLYNPSLSDMRLLHQVIITDQATDAIKRVLRVSDVARRSDESTTDLLFHVRLGHKFKYDHRTGVYQALSWGKIAGETFSLLLWIGGGVRYIELASTCCH